MFLYYILIQSSLFMYLLWVKAWVLCHYLLQSIRTPETEHSEVSKVHKYKKSALFTFPYLLQFLNLSSPETCLISSKLRSSRAVLCVSPIKIHKLCIPSSDSPEWPCISDHTYQMAWSLWNKVIATAFSKRQMEKKIMKAVFSPLHNSLQFGILLQYRKTAPVSFLATL